MVRIHRSSLLETRYSRRPVGTEQRLISTSFGEYMISRGCESRIVGERVGAGAETQGMDFVFNKCTSEDLLMQQRCGWTGAKGRLRREDCRFVKHDKLFSKWKILVGPSDSTEHMSSAGKSGREDGTTKYHIHNLPSTEIGPGVYELGVTAPSWSQAPDNQRTRTVKSEDVIPVYIGQAANIRQRLQKYGQAGAHLEPGPRSSKLYQGDSDSLGSRSPRMSKSRSREMKSPGHGPRLFSEVFALGSSIAFRWAHTDSKVVAEQVESELLAVFDYAWNKGISGTRRSRDILCKLFMAWPQKDTSFCNLIFSGKRTSWLFSGRTNAVGIKVALRKPQDTTTPTNSNKSMMTNLCFLMTMQPRTGSVKVPSLGLRCGVVTNKGLPCNAPPLRGRKRCLQHYEINRLSGATPSPNPSVSTIEQSNVKLQTELVKTRSCLPRRFYRDYFLSCKRKPYCKEADQAKEEKPVERRRHNSLSFNTWVKGESNQRVHDSSDMKYGTSFQIKLAIKQQQEQALSGESATSPRRRAQLVGSKYASVPNSDSRSR